jgi:hypothetical protein
MVKNISHLLLLPILVQKEQTNIVLTQKKPIQLDRLLYAHNYTTSLREENTPSNRLISIFLKYNYLQVKALIF